jgi:hypothetical protein
MQDKTTMEKEGWVGGLLGKQKNHMCKINFERKGWAGGLLAGRNVTFVSKDFL